MTDLLVSLQKVHLVLKIQSSLAVLTKTLFSTPNVSLTSGIPQRDSCSSMVRNHRWM